MDLSFIHTRVLNLTSLHLTGYAAAVVMLILPLIVLLLSMALVVKRCNKHLLTSRLCTAAQTRVKDVFEGIN